MQQNKFLNVIFETAAILLGPQCFKVAFLVLLLSWLKFKRVKLQPTHDNFYEFR